MNILYIGAGFVGACSAAVSGNSGHQTLVYDIDERRIKMLGSGDRDTIESCLFEEGLGDLLVRHADRVRFTSDYGDAERFLDECDVVFLCLPTPEIGDTGESDLSFYSSAAMRLASALAERNGGAQTKYVVVVNKSTVPIDMVDKTQEILKRAGVKNCGVVANPEFLVEGRAVHGSLKPDRVVVGADSEKDFAVMRAVYQRFYDAPEAEYIEVNPREAAAGKLLANFALFNKLAVCFDVVGRAAEAFPGIHFEALRRILTSDPRIGSWGLYDSVYAGGSCFIKDARSLSHQLQTAGADATLVSETYLANKRQLERFIGRAEKEVADWSWAGKRAALLGLSFKRDTNDVRNAPSISIAQYMLERGVSGISAYDPAAAESFRREFSNEQRISYAERESDAVRGADAIIIAADWPQFRGLADALLSDLARRPLILDGRRMLQHRYDDLQKAGFDVIAVGSPFLRAVS